MPSSAWKTDVCSRSEEHTSELQSLTNLVCRLLLEKKTVGVRIIGVVPVHPLPQSHGLLGLDAGELLHALAALAREVVDAEALDVGLALEAQLLLHLHLEPEPLAVEAVLAAAGVAAHGLVADEGVLEGAAP